MDHLSSLTSIFSTLGGFFSSTTGSTLSSFVPFAGVLIPIFEVSALLLGSGFAALMAMIIFAAIYMNTGRKILASFQVTMTIVLPYVVAAWLFHAGMFFYGFGALWIPLGVFAVFVALWHIYPHCVLWTSSLLSDMPAKEKLSASVCFIGASLKSLLIWPIELLAYFVLPVVLLFVDTSADRLPGFLETLWGDVSGLDGDNVWWVHDTTKPGAGRRDPCPLVATPEVIAFNYYLKGVFQRTYSSRLIWLTRNRSSKLARAFGVKVTDFVNCTVWGTKTVIGNGPDGGFGLFVLGQNGKYEIQGFHSFGNWFGKWPVARRLRHGYKLSNYVGPQAKGLVELRDGGAQVITTAFALKAVDKTIDPTRAILT